MSNNPSNPQQQYLELIKLIQQCNNDEELSNLLDCHSELVNSTLVEYTESKEIEGRIWKKLFNATN